ncbi:MAG: GNAT family N-acetyltransferase, partial [Burkholderiales bacterium]|nr:GNAT family N-acetyltransferase [Burkholderiales bacterium]
MKFSLIKMDEIDEALCRRWQDIRLTSSIYGSPYYHPEYAKIAARAKQNAWLLICEDGGQVSGLLPFHLRGSFRAEVIGGVLSDYQGPINLPNFEWPIREMLRAMKVCHFGFNHMPTERKEFERFSWGHSRSQIINLTGGFESYSKNLLETRDASLLKKINTSLRKLSNKYGEVQFAMQSLSDVDFQTLKKGKSEQFIRTAGHSSDIFSVPWISQMLDEIRFSSFPDFRGMLSTLKVDGVLLAAHFGMRSDCVLHYWFPWYCHDFS